MAAMTKKERILCVMRLGTPDRVPVSAGISEMIPVRFSGKTYPQIFHYDPEPLWKIRVDAERRFDMDGFIHVCPSLLPAYKLTKKTVIQEGEDKVIWKEVHHTAAGNLEKVVQVTHPDGAAVLEPLVKEPEDLAKALLLYQDPAHYDFEEYEKAYAYMGDDGTVAPHFATPADELSGLFGGPEKFILAHYDNPELLQRFVGPFTDHVLALLQEFVNRGLPLDVVQIGGAILSHSVTSPEFFDIYAAEFLQQLIAFEQDNLDKVVIQMHTCGKSRQVLEQAFRLGLRAFEPIEEAPLGDVDLREVKEKYGDKMALKGNINSIDTMLHGTPDRVRREVREKLEIGMPGGGFFLAVGDQTPYWTPEENVHALVETVHEFGVY